MRPRQWTRQHGIRLAHFRIRAGILDRQQLALLVGESTNRLYRWERGDGRPDEKQLVRLAKVLGVGPGDLAA